VTKKQITLALEIVSKVLAQAAAKSPAERPPRKGPTPATGRDARRKPYAVA
jgi:hypothetical protein